MLDWVTPASNFIMFLFTIGGATASLAWWLSIQFSKQETRFTKQLVELQSTIIEKLEYHERHDDLRFGEIRGDVMDIRLRNAAIDGQVFTKEGIRRRRVQKRGLAGLAMQDTQEIE